VTALVWVLGTVPRPDDGRVCMRTPRSMLRTIRSLVHHVGVGDLGWVVDAPVVPSGHCLLRLTRLMSRGRFAGPGGYPGRVTVDRAVRL